MNHLDETKLALIHATHQPITPETIERRQVAVTMHESATLNAIETPAHQTDADCTINPENDCCVVCGVYHGDPCEECGERAFHGPACSLNEANGDTPYSPDPREALIDELAAALTDVAAVIPHLNHAEAYRQGVKCRTCGLQLLLLRAIAHQEARRA